MSGGSWNYFYSRMEEVAERLENQKCIHRRLMGKQMGLMAKAMHDIEWVDSGDYGPGDELPAIMSCIDNFDEKKIELLTAEAWQIIHMFKSLGIGDDE